MTKIIFSSDQLPAHLDDRARFSQWFDIYRERYGTCDFWYLPDRPFANRTEISLFGSVSFAQFEGTTSRVTLTSKHIATYKSTQPLAALVIAQTPLVFTQHGRELAIGNGQSVLCTNVEPADFRPISQAGVNNSWITIAMPQAKMSELVARAEDLIAVPIDVASPAVRHLRRYLGILQELDGIADDPSLVAHIETTLADLVALSLGTGRDATHLARMRGLRAARTQEIIIEIKTGFAASACSPALIAFKLGMSVRYLHELLQETGLSFGDRVLELRLHKARAMLIDPGRDRLKISEIAYACGFNEVSYFNRCFRRRFGASPTQYRGGDG